MSDSTAARERAVALTQNPPPPHTPRVSVRPKLASLGLALLISVAWGFASSACFLIPDRCIVIKTPGTDWCMEVDAQMWPPGEPELAEPVVDGNGELPRGCVCFNDFESHVLLGIPTPKYLEVVAELVDKTRDNCDVLVPSGWDHNCQDEGDEAPTFGAPESVGPGKCVGDCSYSCEEIGDLDPQECEERLENASGGSDEGETGTDDETGGSETGGPSFNPHFDGAIAWPR